MNVGRAVLVALAVAALGSALLAHRGGAASGPTYYRDVAPILDAKCASCHRLDREGHAVGPDLLDIRSQPKESILLHVVVPDYEIAPGFAASNVELKDGRSLTGIVASETPESITLSGIIPSSASSAA